LIAIRALSLLAIFHLSIGSGDEGTLGFALTGLTVQASLQVSRIFSVFTNQLSTEPSFHTADQPAKRSFATENPRFVPRSRRKTIAHSPCVPSRWHLHRFVLSRVRRNPLLSIRKFKLTRPSRYILLHARDITAAFPLDLHDHELEFAEGPPERPPEETVLTSLIERFKAFRYSEKVTEELLRFPYSYSTALFRRAD